MLEKPYTVDVFIDAYICIKRTDYVHSDFLKYYKALLKALETRFDISINDKQLSFDKLVLWRLFESTVSSYLQICTPWSGYIESGLLIKTLRETGETGDVVNASTNTIRTANEQSKIAHKKMLRALFDEIFGSIEMTVTSDDLRSDGFDDSKEPSPMDYIEYF